MGDQVSLSSFQKDLGFPINFQEESGLGTFEALNSRSLRGVKRCAAPCPDEGGNSGFLGSPQRIQTSLPLER